MASYTTPGDSIPEPLFLLHGWLGSDPLEGRMMRRSRFTEEQVIGILCEQESGLATTEVCRRHGISTATFYSWKAEYGGLDVSQARKLKALEEENGRLKKLLAEAVLDGEPWSPIGPRPMASERRDVAARKW